MFDHCKQIGDVGVPAFVFEDGRVSIASRRVMEKGGMVQYGTEENGDPLFRFTEKEKAAQ